MICTKKKHQEIQMTNKVSVDREEGVVYYDGNKQSYQLYGNTTIYLTYELK